MAVDLADQHVAARIGAEIRLEQRPRDIERRARFHGQREAGEDACDLLQLPVVEARQARRSSTRRRFPATDRSGHPAPPARS
jgi:hypothetical protein